VETRARDSAAPKTGGARGRPALKDANIVDERRRAREDAAPVNDAIARGNAIAAT